MKTDLTPVEVFNKKYNTITKTIDASELLNRGLAPGEEAICDTTDESKIIILGSRKGDVCVSLLKDGKSCVVTEPFDLQETKLLGRTAVIDQRQMEYILGDENTPNIFARLELYFDPNWTAKDKLVELRKASLGLLAMI